MILAAARDIAEREGLRGLTTRKIANRIGYSVGTLYNVFANSDDLVNHLNAETLESLYQSCARAATVRPLDRTPQQPPQQAPEQMPEQMPEQTPEEMLRALARRYIAYVAAHPNLWGVVLDHSQPNGQDPPDWLEAKVTALLGLAEAALAPLFPSGTESERLHSARVLWAALYGISTLGFAGKIDKSETMTALIDTLVAYYLAGVRQLGLKLQAPANPD
jgi:AcrR family transcriptional regulator|tara:strand:- start:312 stop:968 length:657 start_codon:yes stop_codon:yes gene_type:complete